MTISSPLISFSSALKIRSFSGIILNAKQSLACRLYGLSHFEPSLRGRVLTLVTALDVLSEQEPRTGISNEVVLEILGIAKTRLKEAKKSRVEKGEMEQLSSLVSAVGGLKKRSISASIKELVKDLDPTTITSGESLEELVDKAYAARSQLIHNGETKIDLIELIGPLDFLTAELCAGSVISVRDAAEILQCSETSVLRYIHNGLVQASKRDRRWIIKPKDLQYFMATR